MSAETGGIALLKYLWSSILIPVIWWLFNKTENLEKKSYSKQETVEQIDLRISPMLHEMHQLDKRLTKELDKLTIALNVLSGVLTDLRVEMATAKDREKR